MTPDDLRAIAERIREARRYCCDSRLATHAQTELRACVSRLAALQGTQGCSPQMGRMLNRLAENLSVAADFVQVDPDASKAYASAAATELSEAYAYAVAFELGKTASAMERETREATM